MNVVDSSGWLEYFAQGKNAGVFAPAIEDTSRLIVPTISILEVFKRIAFLRDEDAALQAAALMMQGQVIDLTVALSLEAARLGLAHKLPLADSVILACARAHHATLWTQDSDFKGLPSVKYIEKKNENRQSNS